MTRPFRLPLLIAAALLLAPIGPAAADESHEASRILSVGGAVTEIVYALGEQDRLVARDATSTRKACRQWDGKMRRSTASVSTIAACCPG